MHTMHLTVNVADVCVSESCDLKWDVVKQNGLTYLSVRSLQSLDGLTRHCVGPKASFDNGTHHVRLHALS